MNVAATDIAKTNGTATETVYWRWAFDGDDSADTALGFSGTATATVSAELVLTQVD